MTFDAQSLMDYQIVCRSIYSSTRDQYASAARKLETAVEPLNTQNSGANLQDLNKIETSLLNLADLITQL